MRRTVVILLAILVAAGLGLALESLYDVILGQVLLLILVLVAVMGLGVALRPDRRMPLLCDPFMLYCAFVAQFFVIGPIAMAIWGLSTIIFFRAPGLESAVAPLLACLIMVGMSVVGYRSEFGVAIAGMLPEFRATRRKLPRRWGVFLLAGTGAAGCVGWIEYQGGLFAKLQTAYGAARSGDAVFALAFNAIVAGSILWAWHLFDDTKARRGRVVLFCTFLALEATFFGVLYGARKYLLFLFFGILTCWLLRRGLKALPKLRVAALLALLLVFFSAWGSIRSIPLNVLFGGIGGATQRDARYSSEALEFGYVSGVADPFGGACLIWQIFPEQESFRYGRTLLVTVLGFIPRAVWPDKPVGFGKELSRYYVGPFYQHAEGHSAASTLPGDFYLNFGWPGVVLGGFLMGVLCRIVVAYATDGMKNGVQTRAARVLLPAVFVAGLGEVRADTAQMLAVYVMTMIPMLAALLFFRLDGAAAEPVRVTRSQPVQAA